MGIGRRMMYIGVYCFGTALDALAFLSGTDVGERFGLPFLFERGRWQTKVPYLYLYSDADSITNPSFVEETIERQREAGVSVSSHCFQGSPHVAHLLKYREEYKKEVALFVESLMAGKEQRPKEEE